MPREYPPRFRAEDNFRLTYFEELGNECLVWRPEWDKLPESWLKTLAAWSKSHKVHHAKYKYEEHFDLLESAFLSKDSTFEIRKTQSSDLESTSKIGSQQRTLMKDITNFCVLSSPRSSWRCQATLKFSSEFGPEVKGKTGQKGYASINEGLFVALLCLWSAFKCDIITEEKWWSICENGKPYGSEAKWAHTVLRPNEQLFF